VPWARRSLGGGAQVANYDLLRAGGEFLDRAPRYPEMSPSSNPPPTKGNGLRVRGVAAPDSVDVHGYIALLDEAVDQVMRRRQDECGGECEG